MTHGLDKNPILNYQAFPRPIKSQAEMWAVQQESLLDRAEPLTPDESDYLNVLGR